MLPPHSITDKSLVFISMSDEANGAEKVLFMIAGLNNSPMVFLKKCNSGALEIPIGARVKYVAKKRLVFGFIGLIKYLIPYRQNCTLVSTHPYLSAYLGILKQLGFLSSTLIFRECTSVFTRYKGLKRLSYQIVYRLGYPAAELIICQTTLMRYSLLRAAPYLQAQKTIVLHNPVNTSQLLQKADEYELSEKYGAGFICAAGRLIPEKGFPILIKAFKCIEEKYPGIKLLLFGDGPERLNLSKLIANQGLNESVILKGRRDNVIPYFKHASVCVLCSLKEGFPNVLLEMLTVNTNIVATMCAGGIAEIPGIRAIPVNDVDAMAGALQAALKNTPITNIETKKYLNERTPAGYLDNILKAIAY